jgi:HAD superfamily hydrolase (TIGR01490 family)
MRPGTGVEVNLALFDLDNTLLNGDSDFEWSQFLIRIGVLDRELFEAKNLAFYEHYKAGTLDINEFLDFQLKPLSRHARKTLDEWHLQFMRESVLPMMTQPARDLVNRHLAAGDVCAIITATNSFVTAPIARAFGVENLIATEPEHKGGEFTGRVADIPCFREGKITRLENWLASRGWSLDSFADSTFYSDSLNDLPLLKKVKTPVAANPDDVLRAHAEQHGWRIISLR